MSVVLITIEDVMKLFKSKFHATNSINSHSDWFPVHSSSQLAGIVADLMCDGHLQGEPRWRFDFTSKNIHELKRFGDEIFSLFNIRGKIRPCTGNKFGRTFNFGVNCKLLSRTLHLVGVPTGCKVLQEFLIPNWIENEKECFRTFIRRVFSCEGTVDISESNPFIGLDMWKAQSLVKNGIEFFKQIKEGLENFFKIKSTNIFLSSVSNIRKDGISTRGIRLRIKELNSLINFKNKIGFQDLIKENKLDKIIFKKRGSQGQYHLGAVSSAWESNRSLCC